MRSAYAYAGACGPSLRRMRLERSFDASVSPVKHDDDRQGNSDEDHCSCHLAINSASRLPEGIGPVGRIIGTVKQHRCHPVAAKTSMILDAPCLQTSLAGYNGVPVQ